MLQIALQLDPNYSDAMAYMNLLYRIEAGIADTPEQSADFVAKADSWVTKAMEAKRLQARNPRPPAETLDVDGPLPAPWSPPPAAPAPTAAPWDRSAERAADSPGVVIRVDGREQQAKLVQQVPPVYPAAARQPGPSGTVSMYLTVGKDGKVRDIRIMRSAGSGWTPRRWRRSSSGCTSRPSAMVNQWR